MKKITVFVCLLFTISNLYADFLGVTDSVHITIDKIHHAIVENNWMTQLKIMYQNYNESKKYYDQVNEMSQHKGGIGGYYKDYVINDIKQSSNDEYWRLRGWAEESPDDTNYVKKWVDNTGVYVKDKVGLVDAANKIRLQKDKDLIEVTNLSGKEQMNDKEKNIYDKKKDLLLLRYLDGIDKSLQWMIKEQVEQKEQDAAWRLDWLRMEEKSAKVAKENFDQLYKQRPKKDVYGVIREIPK